MRNTEPHPRWLAVALAAGLLAAPALADQTDQAVFAVSIRGFPVATLSLAGATTGQAYGANGVLKSSGLLGWLRKIRYDAEVTGHMAAGRFVPDRYAETADTGKRQSAAVMAYRAGVPQLKSYDPPRAPLPDDVNPATQGGTIDPLTALYAVLRDVPQADICMLHVFMFDGVRRSQVALSQPQPGDGAVVCAGEYRRLQGFTAADMAEKTSFPFTLVYEPADNGLWHVTEISMDTLYGKGRMIRR